jgi:hypothetical protein
MSWDELIVGIGRIPTAEALDAVCGRYKNASSNKARGTVAGRERELADRPVREACAKKVGAISKMEWVMRLTRHVG